MTKNFQSVMDEISKANEAHGVNVRGGKKYLEVAKRVEVFRKNFGMDVGIETTIEHLGVVRGEPVVMRAVITSEGRTVATGTACEIIGDGNVNKASALENAETSAIGRALAALGLHGGEFASLNEMAAIGTKPENPTAQGLLDAWEQAIFDSLPEDPSERSVAEAYAERMQSQVTGYKTADGVDGFMSKHRKHMDFIEQHAPELHGEVRATALAHRAQAKGKAA